MKNSIKLVIYSLFLVGSMGFYACGNAPTKQVDKTGKEYMSAYVCPMHCKGSGAAIAGKCPVCKMDYVANPDAPKQQTPVNKNGHEGHDHGSHDGHDHGSHEGHDHGSHDGHDHGSHEGHDHDSHEGHNH